MSTNPTQVFGPTINRLADVMAHTERYAGNGRARLAKDARVNASSVSRLLNGDMNPSFVLVVRLTYALEHCLGCTIDPRDLVAEHGNFLTRYACDLVGCRGCLPVIARDEHGARTPAFADIAPGKWVTSRYPKGYRHGREVHE